VRDQKVAAGAGAVAGVVPRGSNGSRDEAVAGAPDETLAASRETLAASRETLAASRETLAAALEEANLPTLLLALAQLTGDDRWLSDPYVPARGKGPGDNDSGGFTEELQGSIRADALRIVCDWRAGRLVPAPAPEPEQLAGMLEVSLGERLLPGYGPVLAEEMGISDRRVEIPDPPPADRLTVLVVGAGVSGLLAAIELQRAGIAFTVIEKDETVGGTWYENSYPGCGVDVPTHFYSLSFEQRSEWPRYFAKRDELHEYLEGLADQYDLRRQIRFGTEVVAATWDADGQCWHVTARDQDGNDHALTAHVLITGVGYFNNPVLPKIDGLESFAGPVMHTARWSSDVEITGKRVAVIGTGASAMQLVPNIADRTDRVVVFQRTPQWGIPHPNYVREVTPATQVLMREIPYYQAWYRARLVWTFGDRLHKQVTWDPEWPHSERSINEANEGMRSFLTEYIRTELGDRSELLEQCVPSYPPYGKRPLLDNGWFRTVARDDVELVTDEIVEVRADRIVTADGAEHEADVLAIATGFSPQRMLAPMEITGRCGRTLRDVWGEDDPRAYLGITMPEFPNLFVLLGPNTFAGHGGSGIFTIELEMRYVMETIALMVREGIASVECRQDVHDAYNDELAEALSATIWAHPGMTTYYRNARGRIVVPMPWTNVDYWHRTRWPDLDDYIVERRR
jgi:4-hydroxyacetophenone monooxygenase